MTIKQAQTILQGYRPGTADAADPFFEEALALVQKDPELQEWLGRRETFDRQVASEFEEMAPPDTLRSQILATAKADVSSSTEPSARGAFSFWRSPVVWSGLAAGVAFCAFVAMRANKTARNVALSDSSLASFAISDAQHPETHGGKGDEMKNLNRVLKLSTTRLTDELPVHFDALRDTGCRDLQVGGHDVLEVCFKRNGEGLHYYVARQKDFPDLKATKAPMIADKPNASIATWSDETNLYIVVTKPDHAALQKLL